MHYRGICGRLAGSFQPRPAPNKRCCVRSRTRWGDEFERLTPFHGDIYGASSAAGLSKQELSISKYVEARVAPIILVLYQGGDIDLSATVYRGFGIAMNVAGTQAQDISGTGIDLDTVTATFGPRYTWSRPSKRISIFGQGLIGISNSWNSLFPNSTSPSTSADSFALQVGGGFDLRLSRHIAVRPI